MPKNRLISGTARIYYECTHRSAHPTAGACSPLPDFFIGAHAAVRSMTLLTRDAARYTSYFPTLSLNAP